MKDTKSLFTSSTFYGALLSVYFSVVPNIKLCSIKTCNITDYIEASGVAVSTLMVILGRYNAKSIVYTPDWMPGRNKNDKPKD